MKSTQCELDTGGAHSVNWSAGGASSVSQGTVGSPRVNEGPGWASCVKY